MAYSCHGLDISKILGPNLQTISNPSLHFQIMLNIRRRRVLFHLTHYCWYINNLREIACLRCHGIKSIFISRVDSNSYVGQWKGEPRLLIILAFILFFSKKSFHKKNEGNYWETLQCFYNRSNNGQYEPFRDTSYMKHLQRVSGCCLLESWPV